MRSDAAPTTSGKVYRRVGVLSLSAAAVDLAARVASEYGLSLDDLRRHSRRPGLDEARQHVMAALRSVRVSSAEIGRLLDRDPSTVCHGIAAHERRRAN